jgi:hypothetical protein
MTMVTRSSGLLGIAALASIGLLGVTSGAQADIMGLGPSSAGSIMMTGSGTGHVTLSGTGLTGAIPLILGDTGTYTLSFTAVTVGPNNGLGFFAATTADTGTLTATMSDGDTLTAAVRITGVADGTSNPRVFGALTNIVTTGDAAWNDNWSASGLHTGDIDFTTTSLTGTFGALALTTNTQTVGISSGEVVPEPLPATLPLFTSGLLGIWAWGRRRRPA